MSIIKFLSPVTVVVSLLLVVVAGCTTSNQQALGVGAKPAAENIAAAPTPPDANTQAALSPATGTASPAANAANNVASVTDPVGPSSSTRVGFLPITGAPQRIVSALSRALGNQSKQHAVTITGPSDQTAKYRLKGYMSALNEGNSTTVTFYWDVLDRANNRLYRINGFEREDGAKSDPWAGVSSGTMSRIAERTMGDLAGWLRGRRS